MVVVHGRLTREPGHQRGERIDQRRLGERAGDRHDHFDELARDPQKRIRQADEAHRLLGERADVRDQAHRVLNLVGRRERRAVERRSRQHRAHLRVRRPGAASCRTLRATSAPPARRGCARRRRSARSSRPCARPSSSALITGLTDSVGWSKNRTRSYFFAPCVARLRNRRPRPSAAVNSAEHVVGVRERAVHEQQRAARRTGPATSASCSSNVAARRLPQLPEPRPQRRVDRLVETAIDRADGRDDLVGRQRRELPGQHERSVARRVQAPTSAAAARRRARRDAVAPVERPVLFDERDGLDGAVHVVGRAAAPAPQAGDRCARPRRSSR